MQNCGHSLDCVETDKDKFQLSAFKQDFKTHLFKSAYNPKATSPSCMCACVCVRPCVHACMHVCTQYATVHFLVCSTFTYYIYVLKSELVAVSMCLYYICVLRSEFCHVCVYLMKLLYVNSCMARHDSHIWPETFLFCTLYLFIHFFRIFLYCVLCFRFHWGSSALEMSVINASLLLLTPSLLLLTPSLPQPVNFWAEKCTYTRSQTVHLMVL